MGDYISRQAAIKKLISNLTYMHTFGADRSIDLIEELPSADVQQVVRCNDCKYFEPYGHYEGWCHAWSGMTVDDAFCSFGERKGGDTDG